MASMLCNLMCKVLPVSWLLYRWTHSDRNSHNLEGELRHGQEDGMHDKPEVPPGLDRYGTSVMCTLKVLASPPGVPSTTRPNVSTIEQAAQA
jgi:hypothetical protein